MATEMRIRTGICEKHGTTQATRWPAKARSPGSRRLAPAKGYCHLPQLASFRTPARAAMARAVCLVTAPRLVLMADATCSSGRSR